MPWLVPVGQFHYLNVTGRAHYPWSVGLRPDLTFGSTVDNSLTRGLFYRFAGPLVKLKLPVGLVGVADSVD